MILVATAWVAAAAPACAQTTAPTEISTAPLEPGDAIRLAFWREPAISGEYPVDETGTVVLPYVGARNISGVPPVSLRQRLLEDYAEVLANQGVHVTLLRRIRILGAVRNPGLYQVDATMSIGDALALAGGLSPNGSAGGIRIARNGRLIPVDLTDGSSVDQVLHSGDEIRVAEASWISRNSAALLGASISALGFLVGQAIF